MYLVTDKSTQHGLATPYGLGTPHKYPAKTTTPHDLLNMVINLYPTGRVWNLPENGKFNALHQAFNVSFLRLINSAFGVIDSTYPDNNNFDADDAALWEYRFGLVTNLNLTLAQRRAIILQKLSYRKNLKARQSPLYIQGQLQDAGFDVYVYENIFFDGMGNKYYKTPTDILGTIPTGTEHGDSTQHGGGTEHGGGNFDVIANSDAPESFAIGGDANMWATFFIAGATLASFATVDKTRQTELRQLVLKLKPAHLVAYSFINYV